MSKKAEYVCGKKLVHTGLLMESLIAGKKILVGKKVYTSEQLKEITLQDIVDGFGIFEAEEYHGRRKVNP